ncbi:MAG: carboxyl transferase [Clostridiales bacterium]|nr:carboxyl transferase [Clostridiales bacterium]
MGTSASAKERIESVLDAGSFMEMGEKILARNTDFTQGGKREYSDGVLTGYGTVEGRPIYIYSQDPDVLGGSLGEMHAEKILRVYDMALKTGAPVIALLDSTGLRIREGADALDAFGRLYRAQTKAKGRIPQIAGVFNRCGGGSALIASLCDFIFTENNAELFINPPAVRTTDARRCDMAAVLSDNTGGQRISSGTGTEEEICGMIRRLIGYLPLSNEDLIPQAATNDDLNRPAAGVGIGAAEAGLLIREIADAESVFELVRPGCSAVMTCFARFNGKTVGVAGNAGEGYLTAEACEIMADFVDFCSAFGIPVLTLTDTRGFSPDCGQESVLPAAAAYLLSVWASSEVPRINLITGKALGNAYTVMNSKGLGADFVFAWSGAQIQVMPGEDAVRILYSRELSESTAKNGFLAEKTAAYEEKAGTAAFVARGYVDKVIAPVDTRKYVIGALEMLSDKRG